MEYRNVTFHSALCCLHEFYSWSQTFVHRKLPFFLQTHPVTFLPVCVEPAVVRKSLPSEPSNQLTGVILMRFYYSVGLFALCCVVFVRLLHDMFVNEKA